MTSIEQRDAQSVLDGIGELLPKLRQRAQETEDLRRLPDATVSELQEIGFFRLLQPKQWGGLECDPAQFYEAARRLAMSPSWFKTVAKEAGVDIGRRGRNPGVNWTDVILTSSE